MKLLWTGFIMIVFLFTGNELMQIPQFPAAPPAAAVPSPPETDGEEAPAALTLQIGAAAFTVELSPGPTADALLERLPLTVRMGELNGNEKFYYLDTPLPTGAERPEEIKAGDLMLYGDNCLVLFYKSFSSSYSYTRLGHVEPSIGLADAVGRGEAEITLSIS